MAFKTDGSSHLGGVKNEGDIINYLKDSNGEPFFDGFHEVEKKGGTKDKNDCLIYNSNGSKKGVSIKNHKKKCYDLNGYQKYPCTFKHRGNNRDRGRG